MADILQGIMSVFLAFFSLVALSRRHRKDTWPPAWLGYLLCGIGGITWFFGLQSAWDGISPALPLLSVPFGVVLLIAAWLGHKDKPFS